MDHPSRRPHLGVRSTAAALLAATAALMAGCSGGGDAAQDVAPSADSTVSPLVDGRIEGTESDPQRAEAFREEAELMRESAAEEGASDAQLAIIDAAIEDGLMSMERLLEARDAYAQCLEATGFSLIDMGVEVNGGVAYPMYATQVSSGDSPEDSTAADNLERACMDQHFMFVDMLYQTQPIAAEASDVAFARALPQIIPCMQEAGVAVDDDATVDEVQTLLMEQMRAMSEDAGALPAAFDCAADAGITSW